MKYQLFNIVGVVNVITSDAGLQSTVENPKRIRAVLVNLSTQLGNTVEGWIGNELIAAVPDWVLDTREAFGAVNAYKSTAKIVRLPIEEEIPAGQKFTIGIRCGAVANNLSGAYEYEASTGS